MRKTKVCSKCDKRQPTATSFHKSSLFVDGFGNVCKSCASIRAAKWYKSDPARHKKVRDDYRLKIKIEVMSSYSKGTPKCVCCGEQHLRFLTINHKHKNGAEHRRSVPNKNWVFGGNAIYRWLRKNNYPKGYEVMCFNCNFASFYGVCPHKQKGHKDAV